MTWATMTDRGFASADTPAQSIIASDQKPAKLPAL